MYLKIKKHKVKNPLLRQFVNFFWTINETNITLNHKFLPLKNIDLIINLSSNSKYRKFDKEEYQSKSYFMGMMDQFLYNWIIENGNLDIIGISFGNFGLYPFVKIPLNEFKNDIIDFHIINKNFSNTVLEQLAKQDCINNRLIVLEDELLKMLDKNIFISKTDSRILEAFCANNNHLQVDKFCLTTGVNNRKLERLFNKYIGASPKKYLKIKRFQHTLNRILINDFSKLSDLAFDNGYYDQMHFIRDFKTFTGTTPNNFIKNKSSLKQISNFE